MNLNIIIKSLIMKMSKMSKEIESNVGWLLKIHNIILNLKINLKNNCHILVYHVKKNHLIYEIQVIKYHKRSQIVTHKVKEWQMKVVLLHSLRNDAVPKTWWESWPWLIKKWYNVRLVTWTSILGWIRPTNSYVLIMLSFL